MMDIKRHMLLAFASWAIACQSHAQVTAAIVRLDGDGPHYLYSVKKLSRADKIHFQFPMDGQPTCCRSIAAGAVTLLPSDPDAVDFTTSRALYRYRLSLKEVSAPLPFIGLAAIGLNTSIAANGHWRLNARTGSSSTDLSLCTSREGVHVQRKSGEKTQDHLYLYLGYDLDNPTCDQYGSIR